MNDTAEHIVAGDYDSYKEVQEHIWNLERRKTRNKIWVLAIVFLIGDLVALSMANQLTAETLVYILVVPALVFGLGFLAMANPQAGMIAVSALVVLIFGYQVYVAGGAAIMSGLLAKGAIVYLLLAGWMSAREAAAAKKNLGG